MSFEWLRMKQFVLAAVVGVLAGSSSTAAFSVARCWSVYFENLYSLVDRVTIDTGDMRVCEHYAVLGVGGDVAVSMRLRRPDGSEYEIEVPSW